MLEALDTIEWSNLRHIYSDEEQVPSAIRRLVSPSPNEHIHALEFLFGSQQDSGAVAETTQHIIPFVLEILSSEEYPSKKEILYSLAGLGLQPIHEDFSIRKVKFHIAAYDALEKGLPIYLELLNNSNVEIRQQTVGVLGKLSNIGEDVARKLLDHFYIEEGISVKIAIVQSLDSILSYSDNAELTSRKQYEDFFKGLVESNSDLQLRYEASRVSIQLSKRNNWGRKIKSDEISRRVPAILVEKYWMEYQGDSLDYIQHEILELLAELEPDHLISILYDKRTNPSSAYHVVRSLMYCAVNTYYAPIYWQKNYWREHPNREKHLEDNFHNFLDLHFAKTTETKRIMHSIVENNIFWRIPTNLFSYFFGLPDSREELRDLIEKN